MIGITFQIPAASHLPPEPVFSQIRTRNLTRTYLRFFDILRPVVVGNIPYRLDFLRIDEIYHPEYIWVPRDPCHRL